MLDPALLRSQPADLAQRLAARGYSLDVARIESLEAERKRLQVRTQELQNLRNTRSKAIGQAKAKGEDATPLLAEVAGFGEELKASESALEQIRARVEDIALGIPNLPDVSVPHGSDESGNRIEHYWHPAHGRRGVDEAAADAAPVAFDFSPKDHVELGVRHGWLDGDTAAKLSGARFTVLRGQLARLHRASPVSGSSPSTIVIMS